MTLRQVAAAAELSVAAVSMALRGTGSVSEATRTRVRRIAAELGYVPDPLLSTLASSRLRRRREDARPPVAVLRPASSGLMRTFFEACRAPGDNCGLELIDEPLADADGDLAARLRQLDARGVVGVFLEWQLGAAARGIPDGAFARFAVVAVENDDVEPRFTVVRRTRTLDYLRLVRHALDRGYRRPGLLVEVHPGRTVGNDFARMGLAALETTREGVTHAKTGRVAPPPLHIEFRRHVAEKERIGAWLARYQPDCVLSITPWLLDVLASLDYRGGFACEALGGETTPRDVSGLHLPTDTVASQAVLQINAMFHARQFGVPEHPLIINVPRQWREGKTLPVVQG